MKVSELIEKLQKCNNEDKIVIIQEETLECFPDYWDDKNYKVRGDVTELFSVDLYSHQFYLLATPNGQDFMY